MIKNLLNADEDPPPGTKVIIEETVVSPPPETPPSESSAVPETFAEPGTSRTFEVPEDAKFFTQPVETGAEKAPVDHDSEASTNQPAEPLGDEPESVKRTERLAENQPLDEDSESIAALAAEIENLAPEDLAALEAEIENAESENSLTPAAGIESPPPSGQAETAQPAENPAGDAAPGTLFQTAAEPPQSMGETIRQSGLAYSAAIVLFGSVVFTMILGWFADLLFGSSPWGIVGGIVVGGIVGFIQFFRITSQIFKK